MYVVLRLYVNPDGSFSHVFADSVADTEDQAIGDAAQRFGVVLANSRDTVSFEKKDKRFSVFSEAGEVRFTVQRAIHLDSSNYKREGF